MLQLNSLHSTPMKSVIFIASLLVFLSAERQFHLLSHGNVLQIVGGRGPLRLPHFMHVSGTIQAASQTFDVCDETARG